MRYKKLLCLALGWMIIAGCAAKSPLMRAVADGDSFSAQTLIKQGADVNIKDSNGYSALTHAVIKGHKDIAKILLENKANLRVTDVYGNNLLLIAASSCNSEMLQFLIDNGLELNSKNNEGATALHNTAQCYKSHKSYSSTKLLIEKGADASIKDSYGLTPLNYALYSKHVDTVAIIRTKYDGSSNLDLTTTDEKLRLPYFIKPEKDSYLIPQGKENAFKNSVSDCNDLVVPYKSGLYRLWGPAVYSAALSGEKLEEDDPAVKEGFQKCMAKMGFQCVKDCSK